MNLLASPLPTTVDIGGAGVSLRTGYRTGIQVARAVDSDLDQRLVAGTILRLYFGDETPTDVLAALEAVMAFHRCGKPVERATRASRRLLDWDHDAGMLMADFRREYRVDLSDPDTRMHWWVFMAYFENLSPDSQTKTAIYYRGASRPKGLSTEEGRHFDAMKRAYALPAKTKAEALAADADLWGD